MDDLQTNSVGYMKFSGEAVPDGIIDVGAAGNSLLGFNECIRYFSKKQSPGLARIEYEIPVKTTEGSWIVWLLGLLYAISDLRRLILKKAGEKMAEKDFADIGLKDVLRNPLMRYAT